MDKIIRDKLGRFIKGVLSTPKPFVKGHTLNNGRKLTIQHRMNLSKVKKGIKNPKLSLFARTRTGIKNPFFGKKHTEETKRKISIKNLGKKLSQEAKDKIRQAGLGRIVSEEVKLRLRNMRLGDKNPAWLGGKSFEHYTPLFNQQLRDRIRTRDAFVCRLCNITELGCNRRLAVHHIDYDKGNCQDTNLISLCQRCHSKVNTNRNYWTGFFSSLVGATVAQLISKKDNK